MHLGGGLLPIVSYLKAQKAPAGRSSQKAYLLLFYREQIVIGP